MAKRTLLTGHAEVGVMGTQILRGSCLLHPSVGLLAPGTVYGIIWRSQSARQTVQMVPERSNFRDGGTTDATSAVPA